MLLQNVLCLEPLIQVLHAGYLLDLADIVVRVEGDTLVNVYVRALLGLKLKHIQ